MGWWFLYEAVIRSGDMQIGISSPSPQAHDPWIAVAFLAALPIWLIVKFTMQKVLKVGE
jgi:hypothetical protein